MNLQHLPRRQDQPVRLGPSHGYRIEADSASINAELHVPPYSSGSNWALQLWACDRPLSGGLPTGLCVASVRLELPTPIGPYVHRVDARTDAILPPRGAHHMVLVLVGGSADAPILHDFSNYAELERFVSPGLEGNVGYGIEGSEVVLEAEAILNPRATGNSSGSLSLELWAMPQPHAGATPEGTCLAVAYLPSILGQEQLSNVAKRVAFSEPPTGRWTMTLLLREWTQAHGYTTRDYRNFDLAYESRADSAALAEPARAVAPVESIASRAAEKLRLVSVPSSALEVPAAAPAAREPVREAEPVVAAPAAAAPVAVAAPVVVAPVAVAAPVVVAPVAIAAPVVVAAPVAAASGRVSIQNGRVEDLARVKGLNLKVAKEIVKCRPYASVDDLINVKGIGEKTLRRIKALITL